MIPYPRRILLSAVALTVAACLTTGVSAAPSNGHADLVVPAPPSLNFANNDPWQHPVRPPICNEAQLEMGDVRACVVRTYGNAAENGWPTPPAPDSGDTSSWVWNGYSYRGSPALAEWESEQLTSNAQRIGDVYVGDFVSHVDIAALFEGFLIEIVARGYDLRNATAYGFRCTNASGGWSCPNGRISDLSFHAWGLAFDMNSDANPIVTHRHPSGGNACEIAVETDMPQWVIQTAEKWGLYWGGYGWGDGCATPSTSAYRDPPHFEFRGTPEIADQILKFNLRNDPNLGCYDVVDLDGNERMICNREFTVEPGWRIAINPGAPEGATAALVNLTATSVHSSGFFSLESCASRLPGDPETSNVNFVTGQDVANLAIIPLDTDGRFCLYHSSQAHGVIDVIAFLSPLADYSNLKMIPRPPTRIVDTRYRPACNTAGKCEEQPIGHEDTLIISNAPNEPYLANLTATGSAAPGYISAGGCRPIAASGGVLEWSNLNYRINEDRANLAIIRPDDAGSSCAYSWGGTDFIVDVLGTLTGDNSKGLGLELVEPERILDTRLCTNSACSFGIDRAEVLHIPVDTDAPVVAANITATDALEWGFVTIDRCSTLEALTTQPETSTVNIERGSTAANLTFAEVENGEICAWSYGRTHLIVDIQAELRVDGDLGIVLDDPVRVYDGRTGGNSLFTQ